MEIILEIAREHNLFLISDETYRGLVFDGIENKSILHIAEQEDLQRIIIADSISKRLNACGARMGVVVSKNKELIDAGFRFIQGRPYAAYIEEEIISPMLNDCLDYISDLAKKYQKRRDTLINALEQNLDIKIRRPEGAFYLQLKIPIADTEKFAKWLLTDFSHNNETVMVSPGNGFYATPGLGKDEIRLAYVLKEKDLEHAVYLLTLAIKKYNN